MKKIFAGIVLPTLAAAAVIGSGFSIWFFGENQDSVSTNASLKVDNLLRIGDVVTSSDKADLHLDQTANVRHEILSAGGYLDGATYNKTEFDKYGTKSEVLAKGIYLTSQDGADTFDGKIKYTPSAAPKVDHLDGACKVQIVTTFTFTGDAVKFVGMDTTDTANGTWDPTSPAGTYKFTWKDGATEMNLPMNTAIGTTAEFKFVYVTGNPYTEMTSGMDAKRTTGYATDTMKTAEPHNDAEYNFMTEKVAAGNLTIETVATIVEVK